MDPKNTVLKYSSVYGETFINSFKNMGSFLYKNIPWAHWAYWSTVILIVTSIICLSIIYFFWSKFLR